MVGELPWTCIWNVFSPYWSLSRASGEAGPQGISPLEIYVERPDMGRLQDLLYAMAPGRRVEKAVVVGQRGTGKSMDLAWLAYELSKTHLVFWVDAVAEGAEVLQDPLGLFVAIALVVYEGAQELKCAPDRDLLEAFLSTCLDTVTAEQASGEQIKVRLDKALQSLAGVVAKVGWGLALATANPVFMAAGGLATGVERLLDWMELSADEKETLKKTSVSAPHVGRAAARLTTLVRDVEARSGRPILVVVDGLDRVGGEQVKTLFERGQDLARPEVRLILTAPLILYAAPEFGQLEDFFLHVVVTPNERADEPGATGQQFLRQVIHNRLEKVCRATVDQVFAEEALELLLPASGGNVRQLLMLAREAAHRSDVKGKARVDEAAARWATNRVQAGLVAPLRGEMLDALCAFHHQKGLKVPPGGEMGDRLLRRKWILAYTKENGFLEYALNPLVQVYLEEEGVL